MEKFVVRKEIQINATPPAAWRALTMPTKTKKYFFNCEVFSDWQEGSNITFKGKSFLVKNIEMNGQLIEVKPDFILKYTLKNTNDTSHSTVTHTLSFKDGITTLSLTDEVGEGEGAEQRYKQSMKSWSKVLKGLKKVVEEEKKKRA